MGLRSIYGLVGAALVGVLVFGACVTHGPEAIQRHLWWSGLGPVLPHETFPADCSLCHVGRNWQTLRDDFEFDHETRTGVALDGSHSRAACLRCHNDRGPVADFAGLGCAGCHEDIHIGQLGSSCEDCHGEWSWFPERGIELHRRTRFPLTGAHAVTSCRRCHEGAEIGRFVPLDVECVSCHSDDLARAQFPDHFALGYVDRCDRCHLPRTWNQAEIDQ